MADEQKRFEIDPEHRAYNGFFRWACGHETRARDLPEVAMYWPRNPGPDGGIGGPFQVEGWYPVIIVGLPEMVCAECSTLTAEEHREMAVGMLGTGWYAKPPLNWPRRKRGEQGGEAIPIDDPGE